MRAGARRAQRVPELWRGGGEETEQDRRSEVSVNRDAFRLTDDFGTRRLDGAGYSTGRGEAAVRGGSERAFGRCGGGRPERVFDLDRSGARRGSGVGARGGAAPERGSSSKDVWSRTSAIGIRGSRPLHARRGGAGSKMCWKPVANGGEDGLVVAPIWGGDGREGVVSGGKVTTEEEGGGVDFKGSKGNYCGVAWSGELGLFSLGNGGGFMVTFNGGPWVALMAWGFGGWTKDFWKSWLFGGGGLRGLCLWWTARWCGSLRLHRWCWSMEKLGGGPSSGAPRQELTGAVLEEALTMGLPTAKLAGISLVDW